MGDYNRGGFGGRSSGGFGGRSGGFRGRSSGGFGGRSGGFDRDRGPVEMHDAVCDKCKKKCQVPFRPTAGKPVLCSDCFKQSGGGSRGGSSSGISPEHFNQINEKLDKIMKSLNIK
jgi:CxxC-x17-CxxC domain-containing protein